MANGLTTLPPPLVASGLITGEALMGVLVALLAGAGVAVPLVPGFGLAPALGIAGLVAVIVYQYRSANAVST